ncbi:LPS-assembly protein LptD [Sphingomonas sp.]|uniref:LPS-assembly protein LptD n=1 Tax=Sphingomonas sp. TaxID=28214 RepID=UPI002DBABCC3|nr:LPS assembly protein LptD [Sphingomonas sp.]HEU4967676.1 LPS assembly protein LptD [Sphingomonas sp.]
MLVAVPVAAAAQPAPPAAEQEQIVEFSADQVTYDSDADVVTATGAVRMNREGNYLAADEVVWNRKTGQVYARGSVVLLTPQGDKLIGDNVQLTDTLRDGTVDNLMVVLEGGARLAAARGTRTGDITVLENAIYSPCPVTTASGCPKRPSWAITAAKVIDDPAQNRVRFIGGRFQLFGITLPLLPVFNVARGNEGATGWLVPDLSVSTKKGFEIAAPYHWQIAPNRDLTITPHVYTGVLPAIEGKYRQLDKWGAFQLGGFLTYGTIESIDPDVTSTRKGLRGYFEANGKAQLNPLWSITSSIRIASDKTVTRRYDITNDDRLRSVVNAERISPNSYISIAGWAFEGLRADDEQREIPIALPAIDARFREEDVLGGTLQLQGNSLSILRIEGQDTQRAFASAEWDLRRITPWGQEVTLTAYARGDVYHTDEAESTVVPIYSGTNGWHTRAIGALAADVKWPFIGPLFGGVQRLVPHVQLVLTPPTANIDIPNEDARSIDLEDSNLFALNRFPGYDRWEDASRITYGFDWSLDRPNLSIETTIGQSYRLVDRPGIFPQGTGLTDRLSDIVGRTNIRYGRFLDLTHRFRIDKDNFAVRRNEIDLTIGTTQTYAQVGYLKLNRNVDPTIEDLRDVEEVRFAARVLFNRYWSVFGASVIDLTDRTEDPLSLADGWEPVRQRLGIQYEDECLQLGVSWKRDYERIGTFRAGNTFAIHLALKGIGR